MFSLVTEFSSCMERQSRKFSLFLASSAIIEKNVTYEVR
jgi:hypothetical protein